MKNSHLQNLRIILATKNTEFSEAFLLTGIVETTYDLFAPPQMLLDFWSSVDKWLVQVWLDRNLQACKPQARLGGACRGLSVENQIYDGS